MGSLKPSAELELAAALPTLKQPIFIVGTIKSGSTLLALCLGQHPLIHYAGFELSAEWSSLGGAPIAVAGNSDPDCPRLSAGDVTEEARSTIRAEFARLLADGQAEVFLNKNPHLSNKLPYLREIFPDASLIVTSRDLRNTVASIRVHWQRMYEEHGLERSLPPEPGACWTCSPPLPAGRTDPARTFPGGDVRVIAEYWLRTYEAIDADLGGFDRVIRTRHSEFVEAPLRVLDEVVADLGIPAHACELPEPVDPKRNDRWRQILSPDEQEQLESWITAHRDRIERLESADTALSSHPAGAGQ